MVHTKTPTTATPSRRKRRAVPILILGAIVLVVAGGLFWFLGGEAPAEVDLAATAALVAGDGEAAAAGTDTDLADAGIDGTWEVDTSVGEFTVADTTTATFAGFRVDEVLSSIGSTTAVGRTPDVSGSITIAGTTLTSAQFTADLTSIVSDEARREDSIQGALNTSSHPDATFVLTEPVELGTEAAQGEAIQVVATGELTINGVTNEVEVELEAQLVEGMVLVTGTTDIVFTDYDVTAPAAPIVLSVEDNGTVEFQLWLAR